MLHAEAAALAQSNGNADAFASAAASSRDIQNCLGTSSSAVAKAEAQARLRRRRRQRAGPGQRCCEPLTQTSQALLRPIIPTRLRAAVTYLSLATSGAPAPELRKMAKLPYSDNIQAMADASGPFWFSLFTVIMACEMPLKAAGDSAPA